MRIKIMQIKVLEAIKEVKILNKEKYVEDIFKQNVDEIEKNLFISFFLDNSMPRLFLEIASVIAVVAVSTISIFMYASTASMIPVITLLAVSSSTFNTCIWIYCYVFNNRLELKFHLLILFQKKFQN